MRKTRKRVFAAVLAAALLFTMPGMASYAEAEDAQTKDISESVTVQAEDDAAEETEAETEVIQESEAEDSDTDQPETGEDDTGDTETDAQEPAEDETVPAQKEDAKECTCGTLCTQDSINGDCHVCGAEDADLSRCKGEKTENSSEENKEDAGQEDTGAQDDSANLCAHHKEHTKDCGYSPVSEDGEGSPCTYECKLCPIEDLIAALPDVESVTENNADEVRTQLDAILDLYRELSEYEQDQIDLSPCWDLQAVLDPANEPVTVDEPTEGDVARVEMPDGTTTYVSALADAFAAGNSGAKITLLADVDIGETTLNVPRDTNFTLDCGNFTLSGSDTCLEVKLGGALTFVGGTVRNTGWSGYTVNVLGTFTMSGGVLDSTSSYALFVNSNNNVHVTVTGGTVGVSGIGLYVNDNSKATIALSGGTYSNINPGREGTYGNYTYHPVSSILAPGYALKGADGFIRGDATGMQKTVTVVECTHDGAATPNEDGATHGGECPYCGTEIAAAPHTLGVGNVCEGCNAALKVKVETSDGTIIYLGESDFAKAFDTYYNYDNVTITLLSDIQPDNIDMGGVQARVHVFNTSTLDLAGHTITSSDTAIYVWPTGTLTIKDSSSDKTGQVVSTDGAAILTQTSMVSLMGGTYTGGPTIDGKSSSTDISSLLANYGTQTTPHYAYFDAQGNPIELEENQRELTDTVTVKECTHPGVKATSNNNGTHSLKCPYCGYTEAAENCAYTFVKNVGTCQACGDKLTVEVDTAPLTYDGTAKEPNVTVKRGDAELTEGYTVSCSNNINAGDASVTVTIGTNQGTYNTTFKIGQASLTIKANDQTITYGESIVSGKDQVTVATLCGSDKLESVTLAASSDQVAVAGKTIIPSAASIKNSGGQDVTGNYSINYETGSLTINRSTPTIAFVSGYNLDKTYDGQTIANPTASNLDITGAEFKDVDFAWTLNGDAAVPQNAGTYILTATIPETTNTAKAEVTLTVTISPKTVNNPTIELSSGTFEYDGTEKKPTVTVKDGGTVIPTDEYTVEYSGNINVGNATVTITANSGGNYNVNGSKTFEITKLSLSTAEMELSGGPYTYDGTAKVPTVSVSKNGNPVDAGEYEITYSNTNGGDGDHTNAGTVTVTVTAKTDGNYRGSCSKTFTIALAPLTADMVTLSPESVTYSGAEQKPTITVKQGDTTLAEGTDYDVTYSTTDFTNAGTITVTITGKGNYTGTVETTYTIKKAPLTITASNQTITYGGSITQGAGNVSAAGLCSGDSLDRITLTAGTANVPGGNITPSAAGIKNSGGKDVTGNYEITYKDGRLTINKADAEITVSTGTYSKTFGDAAFILAVTDNNTEADVQYEVTAGADVISVSNGTVTIKNAGTATITVSLPASTNYNAAASKTITVNVAQKGGYTVAEQNRSYLYSRENTGSIDLAALLPKDCGTVTYGTPAASGNVAYSAAPAVNDGKLSYTLNSGNIDDEGTITVTVSTRNYTDITITVKVKLTDQMPVGLKDGTEVTLTNNILTYGEPLSKLVFNKAEFVDDNGNTVEGTLAWRDASEIPDAGTTGATWVFTPTDKAYASVEGMAAITVNKAVPAVSAVPTVAGRVYDPSAALQDSDLKGGTVNVSGTWGWQKAGIIPTVDNSGYEAVFTPENTTNYETVTRTITVTVTKATPYIAELPAAAAITYGETLKDSLLSGGTAVYGDGKGQAGSTETVAGVFTWKEPSTKPVAADSNVTEYTIVFTPSDTADYNSVEAKVKLTVNKAQNAPNMPGSAMSVSNSIEKVGSVPLPAGWEWQVKDTALEAGVAVSAVAVYTGADKGNYENETVTVAITRADCSHENTELRNVVTATCQKKGYSGDTYCLDCGGMLQKGTETEPTGHSGGTATCISGKVCEVCGTEYTEKNSDNHTHTEIRGAAEAACTADGYTGDTYCTDCNTKTDTGTVIPATGHTEDGGSVTKAPTETEKGIRTYKCSVCGHVMRTEEIGELPPSHTHSYGSDWKSDADSHWHECTCGDRSGVSAHTEDGGSVTKAPTETEKGVRTYKCSICGYVMRTEEIEELPPSHTHSYGTEWKSDADSHWHECTCGDRSGVSAHTEDGGSVTKAPTETEKGVRTYKCSVCGYVMRTEEIGKLPPSHTHSYGTEWKSDSSSHWHECVCGDRSGVSAHTEDGGSVTKAPTETEKGIKTYKCSVCGYVMRTEDIEKLPSSHTHNYGTEWKSDADGHWHECACGNKSGVSAHTEDSGSVTKEPTETEKGVRTYKCSVCGYVMRTEEIEKLPPNSGSGDDSGSGSTDIPAQGTKQPFIKGADGKIGWEVICAEEEQAKEGSVINVDMNGTTVVPGDIFDRLRGRDITITFDMGGGIIWNVDGKSVTTDRAGDIDFDLKTGVNAIPVDIVNNVTGARYSIQISLAHEGEFGFTAVLSLNLGRENAGRTARLYYYNESAGELELVSTDEVAGDGTAELAFTHASDYVIVMDVGTEGEDVPSGSGIETPGQDAQPQSPQPQDAQAQSPQTGQPWRPLWIVVIGMLAFIIGAGVFFVRKKGKEDTDGGRLE